MKAIVRETYGPPDVLHLAEVPLPTLRDGDVLVRVQNECERPPRVSRQR